MKITRIGNDVWIGHGAYIAAGVSIGDGAIIGAHAVVTRDVPAFSVVAGNPASIKKMRVHTQAPDDGQFPPGYTLYSGHLDWVDLDQFNADRFAFTILRDPFERIASFYFYLHQKSRALDAEALRHPSNIGLKKIKEQTVDDYFFGGDAHWQQFIRDHYDNFYCSYFATRKIRGAAQIADIPASELIAVAQNGAEQLDRVYRIESLGALEVDIAQLTGQQISVVEKRVNAGPKSLGTKRWPQLVERLESDANKSLRTFPPMMSSLCSSFAFRGCCHEQRITAFPAVREPARQYRHSDFGGKCQSTAGSPANPKPVAPANR